jgi:hypothetical protein
LGYCCCFNAATSLNGQRQSSTNFIALGSWDVSAKDAVKELFDPLDPESAGHVDLRALIYVDSSVLSLLGALALRFPTTTITLVGPNLNILNLLIRARFDGLFNRRSDVREPLQSASPRMLSRKITA